jgi:hypothetical protein
MKLIIGNTGLVGETLSKSYDFDYAFNTKNIDSFDKICQNGDELFLSCLPATKWKVNKDIKSDIENINSLIKIIEKFEYSKITLISTIDVYCDSPIKSNEDYKINVSELSYGTNRLLFELLIKKLVKKEKLQVFRLPALFNKSIKKNVLYDLIHKNNVSDINTNSTFQWYNLDNLSLDIEKYSTLYPNQEIFNLFTEPIDTQEIVDLFPEIKNLPQYKPNRIEYDYTTVFSNTGYIQSKEDTLNDIKKFINEFSSK